MMSTHWHFDAADPLIREHCVLGAPVVPFACWLVYCQEAIAAGQGRPPGAFQQVAVRELLRPPANGSVHVQFASRPNGTGGRFEVRLPPAQEQEQPPPIAEGSWSAEGNGAAAAMPMVRGPRLERAQFYQMAQAAGLAYGPLLQRVAVLEADGSGWSAEIAIGQRGPTSAVERAATWDALLQCGAVLAGQGSACWVPFHIEHVRLHNPAAEVTHLAGNWNSVAAAQASRRVADVQAFAPGSEKPAIEFLGIHYGLVSKSGPGGNGASSTETGGPKQVLQRLRSLPPAERAALLVQFIEEQLLEVLKWNSSRRGELARGFVAVGLDSLMSVDLQFRLQTALKFALKPGQGLNLPSIPVLAEFLLQKHLRLDEGERPGTDTCTR